MDPLVIPIVAILMPIVLAPTIMILKHRHSRREWEHLERMKAIETRLPIPTRQALAGPGSVTAIGAGVPSVSVLGALMTTLLWEPLAIHDSATVPAVAWGCALFISIGAMITSLKLAALRQNSVKDAEASDALSNGKPVYDPDAFDVVSSRA
jgi:hypothetical protein